jgi:hypothetical protein
MQDICPNSPNYVRNVSAVALNPDLIMTHLFVAELRKRKHGTIEPRGNGLLQSFEVQ